MDELCVVVKKAARIPPELLPLVIFDENLWISLLLAGILIGIVWSALRLVNNVMKQPLAFSDKVQFYIENYNFSHFLAHQSQLRQYTQIFIDSWLVFLSVPMRRFTKVQHERIFVGAVCLVSMVFMSMYQSNLATVLVRPLYFRDINTLKQLDAADLEIQVKYAGYLDDVFPSDTNILFSRLRNKMKLLNTLTPAMDLVLFGEKVATITRKSTVFLDNSIYFVKKKLHVIEKECPRNYFLAYMVPVHSVYLERINEILLDIQRYGFILKWINDITFATTLRNMRNFHAEATKRKVLELNDFKFPFFLLLSGGVLSCLVLMIELTVEVLIRRKSRVAKRERYEVEKVTN